MPRVRDCVKCDQQRASNKALRVKIMSRPKEPFLKGQPYDREEAYRAGDPSSIAAAAILYDDQIWTGARHCDIMVTLLQYDRYEPVTQHMQGFLTDNGIFVSRADARNIAIRAGQLDADHKGVLMSELLW